MAIREGRWDCQNCGSKAILGRKKVCPNCGMPKPDDTKHYILEDAEEVTDEAQLKQAKAGADWYCEHCGGANPGNSEACVGCGAPRGDSEKAEVKVYKNGEVPRSGNESENPAPPPPPPPPPPNEEEKPKKKGGCFKMGCIGLVVIAVIAILIGIFGGKTGTFTVEGHQWARSVDLEEYRTVRESDWNLPAGAVKISEERKVKEYEKVKTGERAVTKTVSERVQTGTERVKVGQKDLGNGYFEDVYEDRPVYENRSKQVTEMEPVYEDRPVYGTWYTYDIDKWTVIDKKTSSGNDNKPEWPKLNLSDKQREGKKTEKYFIILKDEKGKTHEKEIDFQKWQNLKDGQKVKVKMGITGKIKSIEIE